MIQKLILQYKLNKKGVVILTVGGVIETSLLSEMADAILLAWQPGMEGGYAIADVLTGKTYPSGKLSVTFPVKLEDVPATKNFPKDYTIWTERDMSKARKATFPCFAETIYEEDLNVGYRYFQTENKPVSFPFGFGMGYTTFEYSNASVKKKGNDYVATVMVKNTGSYAGKEVVQLYISAPKGTLKKPAYELKAYAKTRELQPGESQLLEMTFSNYDLASYDEIQQAWVTDGGQYTAHFAASAADLRQHATFNAKQQVVKCHNVLPYRRLPR